jgi:hypothetical protein
MAFRSRIQSFICLELYCARTYHIFSRLLELPRQVFSSSERGSTFQNAFKHAFDNIPRYQDFFGRISAGGSEGMSLCRTNTLGIHNIGHWSPMTGALQSSSRKGINGTSSNAIFRHSVSRFKASPPSIILSPQILSLPFVHIDTCRLLQQPSQRASRSLPKRSPLHHTSDMFQGMNILRRSSPNTVAASTQPTGLTCSVRKATTQGCRTHGPT